MRLSSFLLRSRGVKACSRLTKTRAPAIRELVQVVWLITNSAGSPISYICVRFVVSASDFPSFSVNSSVFPIQSSAATSCRFRLRASSSAMFNAASTAIFIGSTAVDSCDAISCIRLSTSRASSVKYAGSPSPRTLYVCPKISTEIDSVFPVIRDHSIRLAV